MLECGKIVNTHGLHGMLKALYYTDSPAFFDSVRTLYLGDGRAFSLLSCKVQKGAVLLQLDGIDTPEKAEALRGQTLYVSRAEVPPLPDGRYYIVDILGMTVATDTGRILGKVTDVFQTGSNDVYTVSGEKEYLIPVIDSVILSTDLVSRTITIKPLKGLLDDED